MLTCELDTGTATTVVRVIGKLTVATSPDVRKTLHKVLVTEPDAIVLDLTGLVVGDDVALTLFGVFAREAADRTGCPVLLCGATAAVHRDLDRMGVTRLTPVHPDRDSAQAAAVGMRVGRRFRRTLAATPVATSLARELVRSVCETSGLEHLADPAELVVTELVANVIQHVGGTMEVAVTVRERFLHLSVRDSGRVPPRLGLPDPETGMGGRGLLLVDALTAGWGTSETTGGKIVWATLRISGR
jgi:anti-anti-sigma factor